MDDGQTGIRIRQLVHDHYQVVYRFALRLSGSPADAEDLVQQTFLIACQKLDQLRSADRARSWLFTITRHCFLKSRTKADPVLPAEMPDPVEVLPDRLPDEFDEEKLQLALGELPEAYRTVVLLYYFEELSYQHIAESLSIPIGTVMSRLARGKQHLRARLVDSQEPITATRDLPD